MSSAVYLDNSATTRVRPEVLEEMLPFLKEKWANPSSIHSLGQECRQALAQARDKAARALNCLPEEIYFSPCATYSNNVALLGRARFAEANGHGKHIVTSAIEHPSVLGPLKHLESLGWQVTFLPVDREGLVSIARFKEALKRETSIISIMWANNEIGSLQPIKELAAIARERQIYFHTDAVQVFGRLPVDLSELEVSTLSLSGHKFYAPKGIGILFVRSGVNIMPIVFGGGQERGLFSGTEPLSNIVAVGAACDLVSREVGEFTGRLRRMQEAIMEQLLAVPGVKLTGPSAAERRLPGHVSVVVPGQEGEALVMRANLKGICISSGSACHHGVMEPSHVLKAIALPLEEAGGAVRISAGLLNTEEECERAARQIADIFRAALKATPIEAVRQ